jgi:hypothetical protein
MAKRKPKPQPSYDSQCYELAQYFIGLDARPLRDLQVLYADLATTIQDAVENWFAEHTAAGDME